MSLFPPNSILEEEIFTTRNLGPDCDIIGGLLYRFGDMFILSALEDGERCPGGPGMTIAVEHYLQLLDSLTAHFITDEHWCWFDDFYSPDYTVSHIWDAFVPHIRSGALAGGALTELGSGLKQIEQSEAYLNYGIPSMIPFSDLKNAKTFLERFGNHSPVFRKGLAHLLGCRWASREEVLGMSLLDDKVSGCCLDRQLFKNVLITFAG